MVSSDHMSNKTQATLIPTTNVYTYVIIHYGTFNGIINHRNHREQNYCAITWVIMCLEVLVMSGMSMLLTSASTSCIAKLFWSYLSPFSGHFEVIFFSGSSTWRGPLLYPVWGALSSQTRRKELSLRYWCCQKGMVEFKGSSSQNRTVNFF